VILEIPAPQYLGAVTGLQNAGWSIVYDRIDAWSDPALGGDWYDAGLERHYIETAEGVTASAPDLVSSAGMSGRNALLVPNAVNARVFAAGETSRPADLPQGPVIGYHGSLYGDWFDWDALAAVAQQHADAAVVLIGEARGVPNRLPGNVVFLGLKAQGELPGYLSRFDAGLVPFAVTETTHAVSPLKVYEYLASGVPVAAPPLRSLDGLDGVYTDADLGVAVAEALEAPRPDPSVALDEHAWGNRLATILGSVGRELAEPTNHPVKIERRPAVHYPRSKRKVIPS
jgi:glycosyltransferase involved in cell wall biosynthesis